MTRRDDEMRHVRILEKRKRPVVFKDVVRNNIAMIVRDEGAQRTNEWKRGAVEGSVWQQPLLEHKDKVKVSRETGVNSGQVADVCSCE